MKAVRLPIQSGSRELARDSEYLLPAKKNNLINFTNSVYNAIKI